MAEIMEIFHNAVYTVINFINQHSKYIPITRQYHNIKFNSFFYHKNISKLKLLGVDKIMLIIHARREINEFLKLDITIIYSILKDIIDCLYFFYNEYFILTIGNGPRYKGEGHSKAETMALYNFFHNVGVIDAEEWLTFDYHELGTSAKEMNEYNSCEVINKWMEKIKNMIDSYPILNKYYKFNCEIVGMF